MRNLKTIYYTVFEALANDPKSRDSDQLLLCRVWIALHPNSVFEVDIQGKKVRATTFRSIADIFESSETITRIRRKIQNDLGLYPPTTAAVAKARHIKEEDWRENMSNNFNKEQSKAILDIFLQAKGATKFNLRSVKQNIIKKLS